MGQSLVHGNSLMIELVKIGRPRMALWPWRIFHSFLVYLGFNPLECCQTSLIAKLSTLDIGYHSIFSGQVGHETTNASGGNNQFFVCHLIDRPTKIINKKPQRLHILNFKVIFQWWKSEESFCSFCWKILD